jgi:hypothetical protein
MVVPPVNCSGTGFLVSFVSNYSWDAPFHSELN